jgi:hypothetical protein
MSGCMLISKSGNGKVHSRLVLFGAVLRENVKEELFF